MRFAKKLKKGYQPFTCQFSWYFFPSKNCDFEADTYSAALN